MEFLTIGIILGLSAGITPGPLLTLVVSETLRHGMRAGFLVALAPLITDLPIILLTFYLSAQLGHSGTLLGLISLAGGTFVMWMGVSGLRFKSVPQDIGQDVPRSLSKGIVTNVLSPYPYIFWLTVGMPIVTRAMETHMAMPLIFLGSFYICIVGAKFVLAIMVGQSKTFLQGKLYVYTMRFLGLVLCIFALMLYRDGLKLTGLL